MLRPSATLSTECLGYTESTRWVSQKLPSEEPFFVLGESFSVPITIALATQPPEN